MTSLNFPGDVDKNSYKPLYIQLSEILIEYISENKLENGAVLPSENELLAKFNISRNTVRLSIDRLVKMGVANKIRGLGTFVIKNNENCTINYHSAFEGSIRRLGMHATNKLLEFGLLKEKNKVKWAEDIENIHGGNPVLIKRLKMADGQLLAIEERILPAHVTDRYSSQELETENISPDLLERYPDTQTKRFKYIFTAQPLEETESRLLKHLSSTMFLRRIGEYFNTVEERFMLSRLTVLSERISLLYEYEKHENTWLMTL
jgi:GntR family transcriptional regulator